MLLTIVVLDKWICADDLIDMVDVLVAIVGDRAADLAMINDVLLASSPTLRSWL